MNKLKSEMHCGEGGSYPFFEGNYPFFESIGKKVANRIKKMGCKAGQGSNKAGDKVQDGLVHAEKKMKELMKEFRKSRG